MDIAEREKLHYLYNEIIKYTVVLPLELECVKQELAVYSRTNALLDGNRVLSKGIQIGGNYNG